MPGGGRQFEPGTAAGQRDNFFELETLVKISVRSIQRHGEGPTGVAQRFPLDRDRAQAEPVTVRSEEIVDDYIRADSNYCIFHFYFHPWFGKLTSLVFIAWWSAH